MGSRSVSSVRERRISCGCGASRPSKTSAWPCSRSSGRTTNSGCWRSTTIGVQPKCDAISTGWTRPRRSDYLQTTVQEPWGATPAVNPTISFLDSTRPVRNAVLRLIRRVNLRLHPCSVAPAEARRAGRRPHAQRRRGRWGVADGDRQAPLPESLGLVHQQHPHPHVHRQPGRCVRHDQTGADIHAAVVPQPHLDARRQRHPALETVASRGLQTGPDTGRRRRGRRQIPTGSFTPARRDVA